MFGEGVGGGILLEINACFDITIKIEVRGKKLGCLTRTWLMSMSHDCIHNSKYYCCVGKWDSKLKYVPNQLNDR